MHCFSRRPACALSFLLLTGITVGAQATELISAEEAARPPAAQAETRGITRGPAILQEQPGSGPA